MFITSLACKLILCTLHACLYALDVFYTLKHKLLHRLKYSSAHDAKFSDAKLVCSSSSALPDMDLLLKVPKHIAVLIGEHDISYRDAANLVVWCLFAGIPHVTLYDVEGALKENCARLYKEISRSQVEHFGCDSRCKVVLHVKGQELPQKNGQRNGYKQHINVHLASSDDGRPHLASIARTFCEAVERREMAPSDITPHLIQRELGAPCQLIATSGCRSSWKHLPSTTRGNSASESNCDTRGAQLFFTQVGYPSPHRQ
nr:dehydrodolichyl diphosphate synthase complex subunit NUS1-like isoform X2 [Rhipicephalus microplus]